MVDILTDLLMGLWPIFIGVHCSRVTSQAGYPWVINTDEAPSLARPMPELKGEGVCPPTMEHQQAKQCHRRGLQELHVGVSDVEGADGSDALGSRKGQGTMFAYGHPNPDAVIISRAFKNA